MSRTLRGGWVSRDLAVGRYGHGRVENCSRQLTLAGRPSSLD